MLLKSTFKSFGSICFMLSQRWNKNFRQCTNSSLVFFHVPVTWVTWWLVARLWRINRLRVLGVSLFRNVLIVLAMFGRARWHILVLRGLVLGWLIAVSLGWLVSLWWRVSLRWLVAILICWLSIWISANQNSPNKGNNCHDYL